MLSRVDTSDPPSSTLCQRGEPSQQNGDMVIDVDRPDRVREHGPSGTGTNAAERAAQEVQRGDHGVERGTFHGDAASVLERSSLISRVFITIKQWLGGTKKQFQDDRNSHLVNETLDEYPLGYPRLAAYINSDVNFSMYRRFGTLRNRVLLHRQDELSKLEKRLKQLDVRDNLERNTRIRSIKYDGEKDNQRIELVEEIDRKLEHYGIDEMLLREQKLKSMGPPTKRNHRSLFNWIWNLKPLVASETDFIFQEDDFVTLADGQDDSWFDGRVEDLVKRFPSEKLQVGLLKGFNAVPPEIQYN
ncbi:MAG: hypothetical protein M1830_003554 [Pleopsidium flavum]|nr:MAG: hypothetical protein M1830_003554 [Pleopsidium flavum]